MRTLSLSVHTRLRIDCETISSEFRAGLITMQQVNERMAKLEEWAYAADSEAEPDGDITYYIATMRDRIEKYASENKNK